MDHRNSADFSFEPLAGVPAESAQPASTSSILASRLTAVARVLRERSWVIVIFVVVLGAAAYARSVGEPSMYTATSTLTYDPSNADRALSINPAVGPVSQQNASPTLQTVNLETLRQLAGTAGVRSSAARQVGGIARSTTINATTDLQTNLLNIAVTARSSVAAARLANAWAQTLVAKRTDTYRASFTDAIRLIENQLAQSTRRSRARVATLTRQLQLLQLAVALQQGDLVLAQPALVPRHRSSPDPAKAAALGAGLGLVLAILALALLDATDRRIKRPEDIEGAWGAPLLATIPPLSPEPPDSMLADLGSLESFRALQTSLIFAGSTFGHPQVIVVSSATPAEGKSVVALGLAGTLARAGHRLLLIDADYRHPSISAALGLTGPGFSNAIVGTEELSDILTSRGTEPARPNNGNGSDSSNGNGNGSDNDILADDMTRFDCLGCGIQPPDPLRLFSSPRVGEFLAQAREEWDYTIIDCPPLLAVSDAIPLIQQADGVLICARLYHSHFHTVRRARQIVERMRGRVLGVALATPKRTLGYGYGYGYGYRHASGSPNGAGRFARKARSKAAQRAS